MFMMPSSNSLLTSVLKYNSLFSFSPLKQYRDDKISQMANEHIKALQTVEREVSKPGLEHRKIQAAKLFIRDFKSSNEHTISRIDQCSKEILALQLGIESKLLDLPENDLFREFASTPPLAQYLKIYGDALRLHGDNIFLKVENSDAHVIGADYRPAYRAWSAISKETKFMVSADYPTMPWKYGPYGVHKKDLFQWSDLSLFKTEDASKWDKKNIFEFCICLTKSTEYPSFEGDHTWLRLRQSNGQVYSTGLYIDPKVYKNPGNFLSVNDGFIQSPDVSEFWKCAEIVTLQMEVTEQELDQMKRQIVSEKSSEKENKVFQITKNNCLQWTKSIAKISKSYHDINTMTSSSRILSQIYAPVRVFKLFDAIYSMLPRVIQKIWEVVGTIITTIVAYKLGGSKSTCSSSKEALCAPQLNSVYDIFNETKAEIHHPFNFAKVVIPKIKQWRETELKKIAQDQSLSEEVRKQQLIDINYKLPSEGQLA